MSFKAYINTEASIFGKMSAIAKAHNAINFTQGAPDFETPPWLIDRLHYYAKKGFNQYAPISGAPSLKQAIVQKVKACYDVDITAEDNVCISSGAVEAIFALISAYVAKGDEVIYFDPAFDVYPSVVSFNQGVSCRLPFATNGSIDIKRLAQSINDKTKLIILNSPHNPMGSIITRYEYQEIAKLVKGKDILVLSDEVYEHIHAGESYTSALEIPDLRNQLIVVQSLGKTYNLTGWRLGVCVAPKSVITIINAIRQFTSFSASHPMQLALADGITAHPEYWQKLPKLYQTQHKKLVNGLANSRFKMMPWAGSPFQMLDYSGISHEDDFTFCQRLIKEYGVGLVPISSLYETPKQGLLRLCFAKYDEVLLEGVKRLCQV